MSRFLIALTILSVVVMTQSVVAITPATVELDALGEAAVGVVSQPDVAAVGGLPEPAALCLLLTGLSGLAAAGHRSSRPGESTRI